MSSNTVTVLETGTSVRGHYSAYHLKCKYILYSIEDFILNLLKQDLGEVGYISELGYKLRSELYLVRQYP
jgi:hypothetical protein